MNRHLTLIGAASSIGIKPYADGTIRHVDRAPATLRQLGLGAALGARDAATRFPSLTATSSARPGACATSLRSCGTGNLLAERVADGAFRRRLPHRDRWRRQQCPRQSRRRAPRRQAPCRTRIHRRARGFRDARRLGDGICRQHGPRPGDRPRQLAARDLGRGASPGPGRRYRPRRPPR